MIFFIGNDKYLLSDKHFFSPKKTVLFNDEYRDKMFIVGKINGFNNVHNSILKDEICKNALDTIKDIYKKSKVKLILLEDSILSISFINSSKTIYFMLILKIHPTSPFYRIFKLFYL